MSIPVHPTGTARMALTRAINHVTKHNADQAAHSARSARNHLESGTLLTKDFDSALNFIENGEFNEASFHLRTAAQRIDAQLEVGR